MQLYFLAITIMASSIKSLTMRSLNRSLLRDHSPPTFFYFVSLKTTTMRKILLYIIFTSFSFVAGAQITKGNWLIGGNMSYAKNNSEGTDATNSKSREINVSGNIGYFPFSKFATGLLLNTFLSKARFPQVNGTTVTNTQNSFGGGVFARYYFLKEDNRVNVFTDEGVIYSSLKSKTTGSQSDDEFKSINYYLSAGTVIFLNTSVGAEFIVSYNRSKAYKFDSKGETLRFKIGLQFHLEKE